MRYDHRIIIGLTGAIGKMGPQSQIITNKVAYQIGTELGAELNKRGKIRADMGPEELWTVLNTELEIDPEAKLSVSSVADGTRSVEIEITSCNICPKKVGKYAIPGTACPVGGIFRGVASTIDLINVQTAPNLIPGDVCKVTIQLQADAS